MLAFSDVVVWFSVSRPDSGVSLDMAGRSSPVNDFSRRTVAERDLSGCKWLSLDWVLLWQNAANQFVNKSKLVSFSSSNGLHMSIYELFEQV